MFLSLMLKDSIPEGLIAAVNVVKLGGPIYIVLDITKFGLHIRLNRKVKEEALARWKKKFIEACGGSLKIAEKLTEKTDGMVYIELKNVSSVSDRLSLTDKLRKTPHTNLDSLKLGEDEINELTEEHSRKRPLSLK